MNLDLNQQQRRFESTEQQTTPGEREHRGARGSRSEDHCEGDASALQWVRSGCDMHRVRPSHAHAQRCSRAHVCVSVSVCSIS